MSKVLILILVREYCLNIAILNILTINIPMLEGVLRSLKEHDNFFQQFCLKNLCFVFKYYMFFSK